MFFDVASKGILDTNEKFVSGIKNKDVKIGSYLPCSEIIRENIKEYRPYMD